MHAAVFREKYGGLINNFLFVLQCSAAAAAQTLKWMIYGIEISREFACYVVKGKINQIALQSLLPSVLPPPPPPPPPTVYVYLSSRAWANNSLFLYTK